MWTIWLTWNGPHLSYSHLSPIMYFFQVRTHAALAAAADRAAPPGSATTSSSPGMATAVPRWLVDLGRRREPHVPADRAAPPGSAMTSSSPWMATAVPRWLVDLGHRRSRPPTRAPCPSDEARPQRLLPSAMDELWRGAPNRCSHRREPERGQGGPPWRALGGGARRPHRCDRHCEHRRSQGGQPQRVRGGGGGHRWPQIQPASGDVCWDAMLARSPLRGRALPGRSTFNARGEGVAGADGLGFGRRSAAGRCAGRGAAAHQIRSATVSGESVLGGAVPGDGERRLCWMVGGEGERYARRKEIRCG